MYNACVATYTLEELQDEAQRFAATLSKRDTATVVALYGDLGAGKTTFTQALARSLGVEGNVVSPTFIIQRRYPLEGQVFSQLIHIDAYRLEEADQLRALGWEDIVQDPDNLIIIEWPEHVLGVLDGDEHELHFTHIDEETREINYGEKESK